MPGNPQVHSRCVDTHLGHQYHQHKEIKVMDMQEFEEINIRINMPSAFMSACEMFDIDPGTALQYFLEQISIYFHLTKRCNSPRSLASTIFNEYLKDRGVTPETNYKTRLLNIDCMKKVLSLISSEIHSSEKDVQYADLINQWYEALRK